MFCRAESWQTTLRRYEVGPAEDGHCALCGSLYCQECLRPFLPHDALTPEGGLRIQGEKIYCAYANCGAGHSFRIDDAGRVVLRAKAD